MIQSYDKSVHPFMIEVPSVHSKIFCEQISLIFLSFTHVILKFSIQNTKNEFYERNIF